MFRRLLLAGVLVFVVAPTGWILVEHARGQAQLAEAIRRIEARGGTLDFPKLLPPPAPGGSNGLGALMSASQRLSGFGAMMPPGLLMVSPGHAIAGTRMDWWPGAKGSNTWVELEQVLAKHEDDFEDLHAALALPYRRADLDLSRGFAAMRIPHLSPVKNSATSLAASATEAAHRGAFDVAVSDLAAMRVVESDLESEPILISQLVRIACASIANARIWAVLQARDWDEAQLARLQAALPSTNYVTAVVRSLEGERAGALYEILHAPTVQLVDAWTGDALSQALGGGPPPGLQVPENVDEAVELAGTFVQGLGRGLLRYLILPVWRFAWGDQAAAFYLDCMERMIAANREGDRVGAWAATRSFDLSEVLHRTGPYARLRVFYAAMTMPALEKAAVKAFRVETERALHETGIALQRFRLRHGRLPAKLDELVPEFLATVPLDRMDGQPVRYRRDSDTTFTLWGVGEDLKDDGGDATWPADRKNGLNAQWWLAKDAVWPQLASGEEIATWHADEAAKLSGAKSGRRSAGTPGMSAELMKRYGLVATNSGSGSNVTYTISPELMKRYGLLPRTPPSGTNQPGSNGTKPR